MYVPHAAAWLLIVAGLISVDKRRDILAFEQINSFQQLDTDKTICGIVNNIASILQGEKIHKDQ
jgi:hypothetical protein